MCELCCIFVFSHKYTLSKYGLVDGSTVALEISIMKVHCFVLIMESLSGLIFEFLSMCISVYNTIYSGRDAQSNILSSAFHQYHYCSRNTVAKHVVLKAYSSIVSLMTQVNGDWSSSALIIPCCFRGKIFSEII
jgi:hypothetical protein